MQRTVGVLGVIALALASCKKPGGNIAETMAAFEGFVTAMCACKDKACADHVQEAMTKWSMEMAQNAGSHPADKPDEAALKAMTELGQNYAECMTKVMGGADVPPPSPEPTKPTEPAKPPEPPQLNPVKLSAPADRPTVAKLMREAKAYTGATEDRLTIHYLKLSYVAVDGMLDPTYGELAIKFGNAAPKTPPSAPLRDDPDRPTGAPIPDPPAPPTDAETRPKRTDMANCPTGTWTAKAGWTWGERMCSSTTYLAPRCSAAEVWKRAKARRPTTKAIAIMELVSEGDDTQSWYFTITDTLRKVAFELHVDDTCAVVVEKP